jgi:hypothetical protein
MQLLTQQIKAGMPKLRETESIPLDEKIARVKFFTPWTGWTWYGVEFDGEDLFWGLVDGDFVEWGYFSLRELQSARGPLGLTIERDKFWEPKTIARVKAEEGLRGIG